MKHVTHDDLLAYGLIPEFVGRLPMVVGLESLTKDTLIRILTEPKNAVLRQFQRFFALDGVELVFTQDALEACADEAIHHKTGARGLRTVLEDTLLDVMYEVPSRTRRREVHRQRRHHPPAPPPPAGHAQRPGDSRASRRSCACGTRAPEPDATIAPWLPGQR